MREYRGIQLDESVKLYMKNGEYNKKVKSGLDNFADKLEESNYKTVGFYVKMSTNIKGLCDKGHEIEIHPNNFVTKNRRCRKCDGQCPEQAKENFYNAVKKEGYILLSEYIKASKTVQLKCDKGHLCEITPNNFISKNTRCERCSSTRMGKALIKQAGECFSFLVESNGHVLLTPYKHSEKKVLIDFKCKEGHKPSWVTPHVYKSEKGTKCGYCVQSKGVLSICHWLDGHKINYELEKRLSNERKYDIYIPSENLLVEVHGKQHYINCSFFYGKGSRWTFKQQKENDRQKRLYAEKLEFNYMEVDYRESKPKLALERFLKGFNEIGRIGQRREA